MAFIQQIDRLVKLLGHIAYINTITLKEFLLHKIWSFQRTQKNVFILKFCSLLRYLSGANIGVLFVREDRMSGSDLIISPIAGTEWTTHCWSQVRIPTCLAVSPAGGSCLRFSVSRKIIGKMCCLHVRLLGYKYKGKWSFRINQNPLERKKMEWSHNFLGYNI